MSRLVIIDGHAIAHRAYHSIPPLTVNGQPVNAIYGFYSMLLTALDILKPDYLIVCLDSPGPTFRQTEFLGYRAKRQPADHDLVVQLPELPKTLSMAKISSFAMGGYEADDLIATLARKSLKRRWSISKKPLVDKITIITGDKDLMQLVDHQIELFMPIRGLTDTKIFGPTEVFDKLMVTPSQVVDFKALMGDMSDNYPGVAGIGPKTASELLNKYGTLDQIYLHLSDLTDPIRQKLEKDKANAYLSKKLATLISNIPLNFSLTAARWHQPQAQQLISLFDHYHFRSLISRITKKYQTSPSQSNQTSLF